MLRTISPTRWAFAALMLAIMLAAGCGGESADSAAEPAAPERPAEEVKADFDETMAAYRAEEDEEKQFQIWFDFLERNPNGDYTVGTLGYLANQYHDGHMGDPAGAVAFVEEHMKRLSDDRANEAMDLLINLNGKAGNVDKLREIASGMEADGKLNFGKHLTIANACASAEDWGKAVEHAQAAYDGTTPEAVKVANADREMSEDDIANSVKGYKGRALTTLGRAQAESGDVDASLDSFSAAEEFVTFNYVGVPSSNINVYWSKALIAKGDYDAAMRRIAPDAIMQGDEDSMEVFKEAYEKSGGSEAGLESAIENMRAELARPIEEFHAYTYEGEKVAWSELKGRVTLLSFWFPT